VTSCDAVSSYNRKFEFMNKTKFVFFSVSLNIFY
jgi:hypothetical protein